MESFKSMEGYLHKKGGSKSKTSGSFSLLGRRNWTHRYFCLEGTELTYWKTTGGKRLSAPQGRVVLGEAELLDATIDGRDHAFAIKKPSGAIVWLQAESAASKALWLDALARACAARASIDLPKVSPGRLSDASAPSPTRPPAPSLDFGSDFDVSGGEEDKDGGWRADEDRRTPSPHAPAVAVAPPPPLSARAGSTPPRPKAPPNTPEVFTAHAAAARAATGAAAEEAALIDRLEAALPSLVPSPRSSAAESPRESAARRSVDSSDASSSTPAKDSFRLSLAESDFEYSARRGSVEPAPAADRLPTPEPPASPAPPPPAAADEDLPLPPAAAARLAALEATAPGAGDSSRLSLADSEFEF